MSLSRSKPLETSRDHDWEDRGEREYRCTRCGERIYVPPDAELPDWKNCPGMQRTSGLDRGSGPAPVSDRRREKRPDLRTPLQTYVERLPCLLAGHPEHACRGEVVAHHVVHKNHAGDWLERGGERVGNLVSLCSVGAHQDGPESVHVLGRETFEARWGVRLDEEARRIGERFEASEDGGE